MGSYMARVFGGERTLLSPVLRPVERLFYRLFRVNEQEDMRWTTYAFAMLAFSVVGGLFTYALLRLQGYLPLNPQHFTGSAHDSGPVVQHGDVVHDQHQLAELLAGSHHQLLLQHGRAGDAQLDVGGDRHRHCHRAWCAVSPAHSANGLGNFWVDMTRATLYVLLPICLVYALFLVWQGVPQNFAPYTQATTLEGAKQTIAQGPVASQEAIKMLGTNGGGFFNANSAHPYENPTPLIQLAGDFLHLPDSRRADLHLRQDGGQHEAGLGDLRGHDRAVCRRRLGCATGPKRRGIRTSRDWA